MFPHPGFIDSVTALGNFEWRISIQGATDEAHVATTGRADSFQRIVHGLGELQRRGQLVTTNMCVNERSYRSLPHYPELLERYGVRQLHVDIVRPESTGERDEAYLRDIMPRYSDMAPYYAEMLAGFERWNPDFDVNVGNLPYCILPDWASRIHHGGQQTVTKSSDGAGLEDEMNKYEWQASLRTHLPGCADCVFRSRCTGIFRVYLELHGGDEFQPVSRAALAARRSRSSATSSSSSSRCWRRCAPRSPPASCRRRGACEQEITEDRRRRVEIVFAHDGRRRARAVTFVGAGQRPRAGDRARDAYDVDAEADLSVPPEALAALLDWLRARLAAARCRRAAGARRRRRRARPARRRAGARTPARRRCWPARLQSRFARPGLAPRTPALAERQRRRARRARPRRRPVDVRFTLGARGNRSQVGVDFGVAEQSDDARVKAVVSQLVALLRGPQPAERPTVAATIQ